MLTVILFYSTYIGGIFYSFYRYPILAFVTYQAVYFYNPNERWWSSLVPELRYSFYISAIICLLFVFNFKEANKNPLFKIPQFRWSYAFFSCFVFAAIWSPFPEVHTYAIEVFAKLLIIVSLAYKLCDTPQKLNWILWAYIYGSWYISYLAFQLGRNSGNRVQGIGTVDSPDANGTAAAIAPAIVVCLYFIWKSKNKWLKLAAAIAAVFIANALILINSRGAVLGVAVSVFYFFSILIFSKVRLPKQRRFVLVMLTFSIVGGIELADEGFIERVETMFVDKSEIDFTEESGATRILFWKAGYEMAKDYPFGAGARAFVYYSPIYIPQNIGTGKTRNRAVHSSWIESLTESGFIGLFCFCMIFWSSFRTLNICQKKFKTNGDGQNYHLVIAIKAAIICFMITMTFLNRMRAEVLYWLVLYSACLYNIYILKPQISKNSPLIKDKV